MDEKKVLRKQIDLLNCYKRVFETDDGKKVLNDLIKKSCFLMSTHVPGDPYSSANNEGKREIVLYILKVLETKPEMLRERIEQVKEEDYYAD